MRLVALKLNQKTTNERIRKAKTNRDRRLNPSKETIALKGLVILITNVSKQVWTSNQVASAYGFRWSIENIFKCWKSAFNMQRFLLGQQSKVRVESIIYSLLVFITLFQLRLYHYWLHKIYKTKNVIISLMKFAKLISENMRKMMESTNDNFIMEQIAYYCKYDKRSDRINYLSSLYGLS